jgi:hypothetical protein
MEYLFPFDTCEKPKNGIAQPYSSLFNAINCIIILSFLYKTKKKYTFYFLFFILLFEIFHLFSHMIHIQNYTQLSIIHLLSYCINLSLFYTLYRYTNKLPTLFFLFYLFLVVVFDIYSFLTINVIHYIVTQTLLFSSLLLYYRTYLPDIRTILVVASILILLLVNEKYNCEKMLSMYPTFPFHIFVEIGGILFFYFVCSTFYKL